MIEYLASVISDASIAAMRVWIADCPWENLTPDEVPGLTDRQVVNGVARYFDGGVEAFLAAGQAVS